MHYSPSFIKQLPKADLHVHLDGSLRLSTLIDIAVKERITLPAYSEKKLQALVFKPSFKNLADYLTCFDHALLILRKPEHLERCAYELGCDAIADGVRYIEVRFAPQQHAIPHVFTIEHVIQAVHEGLKRAETEHNQSLNVKKGQDIPFVFGVIVCAMRSFSAQSSAYYAHFLKNKKTATSKDLSSAALELIKCAVQLRDKQGLAIVGLDIAGKEVGWRATTFKPAYEYAQKHLMCTTVHAGEDLGAESIYNALIYLHPDRIGHGLHIFNDNQLALAHIKNRTLFLERLAGLMARKNIAIESCISSNFQTNPSIKDLSQHPLPRFVEWKIPVVLCTDNRLVSRTTLSNEYEILLKYHPIQQEQLKALLLSGFTHGFYPGLWTERNAFITTVEKQIDSIFAQHQNQINDNA